MRIKVLARLSRLYEQRHDQPSSGRDLLVGTAYTWLHNGKERSTNPSPAARLPRIKSDNESKAVCSESQRMCQSSSMLSFGMVAF